MGDSPFFRRIVERVAPITPKPGLIGSFVAGRETIKLFWAAGMARKIAHLGRCLMPGQFFLHLRQSCHYSLRTS